MDFLTALFSNLCTPAVLFFALGVAAAVLRSDLKFPEPFYVALTVYLLVAIGFKGGVSLAEAGLGRVLLPGLAALGLGAAIPLWTYPILRVAGRMSAVDAAAVAAHYGSVSAVTFIAATNYLKSIGVAYENHATALLAVMESPAILTGVLLARLAGRSGGATTGAPVMEAVREAMLGRSVILLVGGLVVGALSGEEGMAKVEAFFVAPFQGVLALFLLEMGTVAGRRLGDLRKVGAFLVGFGLVMPVVHGMVGVIVGHWAGLELGGATLFGVLAASASYIAAPAAIRMSLPEANPTYYLTASLAITFPFNIALGIPLYYSMARWWYS
ncbi:MAG: sodium-dependent bicarbonate transport family permease [Verrucomicrobiae bacterium]|nr:sodium-dependent bicarbonate transport family permease [Verrucomicrobiae bacterium]